jgi:16S rRNA (cytosine967-C5)-methyltransferase
VNAREVALQTVRDVFPPSKNGIERGAQEAFDYRVRKAGLDARDRAFATELCYGAIKMRRTVDWYLHPYLGERERTLPPAIREILRLAIYEIVYTRCDAHATVFEFVNLAKRHGHRGVANLVNAVLRSFLRDAPSPPAPEQFERFEEYLGVRYSLPTWLTRQWRDLFGERAQEICQAVNAPAVSAVTVNTARLTAAELIERFTRDGVGVRPSALVAESLVVDNTAYTRAQAAKAGEAWWIQSESSAMAVDVLNPQPEERILDVCSGRGNKALQIAARLVGGELCCLELDDGKAAVLRARLAQAGATAAVIVGDARNEVLSEGRRYDRVLVDAPCSGVGVVGRHPEARWKKQPGDGERLALTQRAILERIAPVVHEGGVLVYAVCSTDPRETVEVVEWFRRQQNFERGLIPAPYAAFLTEEGDVRIPPGLEGRDGFFIARLERR